MSRAYPSSRLSALALTAVLALAPLQQAHALTFVLDFFSDRTDIFGERTVAFDYSTYGFDAMDATQVREALLNTVIDDFLGYPSVAANGSSPLPAGKELNLDFMFGTVGLNYSAYDSEWYFIKIGSGISGDAYDDGALGQACYQCVRTSTGVKNFYGNRNTQLIGSIFTNNIDNILTSNPNRSDTELINLIAGTISHEIGHTLSLEHPNGALANPGASVYDLMATGVAPSNMPNAERFKDRDFAYSNFAQLMTAVGLRDAPAAVPEPGMLGLLGLGLLGLGLMRRRA